MGADYVGFIGCELQKPMGTAGFLRKLKLRAYRSAIESQVPAAQRLEVNVQVMGTNNRPESLSYGSILEQLGTFEKGCAVCATCVTGSRQVLGCYRYVTYPVDARFEQILFEFFVEQLKTKDSIGDQIYRDIASTMTDTGFHARGDASMTERAEPLVHRTAERTVDSAQLLAAFFLSSHATARLPEPAKVAVFVGYKRLINEFVSYARPRVTPGSSRTLGEVESLLPLYMGVMMAMTSGGGTLVVDS